MPMNNLLALALLLAFLIAPSAVAQVTHPLLKWSPSEYLHADSFDLRGDVRSAHEWRFSKGLFGNESKEDERWYRFDSLGRTLSATYLYFSFSDTGTTNYTWHDWNVVEARYPYPPAGIRMGRQVDPPSVTTRTLYTLDSTGRLLQAVGYDQGGALNMLSARMYDDERGVMQRLEFIGRGPTIEDPFSGGFGGTFVSPDIYGEPFEAAWRRFRIIQSALPDRYRRDTLMIMMCNGAGESVPDILIAYDTSGRIVDYRWYHNAEDRNRPTYWQQYSYNDQGDIATVRSPGDPDAEQRFEYLYDSRGNWVERREYIRKSFLLIPYWSWTRVIERRIEYGDE